MKPKDPQHQASINREPNTYQTGFTAPPKKYSVLVTVLLVLVVFLSGLVSLLGLMNFKLFSDLYEEQMDEVPVAIKEGSLPEPQDYEEVIPSGMVTKIIGLAGDMVTTVYQQHFQLPEGLFITYVEDGTTAHKQGIRVGDVLTHLEGIKITEENQIQEFLEDRPIGDTFEAVVYRRDTNTHLTVHLTVEEASS